MPLKNTVAVERRMDLASLFCMIGRHGPAVALAVVAMVSVLAAFIIYRTVRGKRRKAAAAAVDGDSKSRGEERDAAVIQPSPEESTSSPESTDVSDEGSSNVKEDVHLIQSDLKIRHRRAAAAAAAERKPPPYSPPIQVPEDKHIISEDTEEKAVVRDSCKVAGTCAEEASEGLPSATYTVAEMVVDDAVDCQQSATDDIVEDVIEEVHDNDSCLKEPEPINDENHEKEEKVVTAECQEDEDVTADRDDGDEKTRQEEDNLQCALNNSICFEQTPHMGEMDDDRLQDNAATLEANSMESSSEEPVDYIKDVPAPYICYGKDEEFEEVKPDSIYYSSYSGNNHLSPEEERKDEVETAKQECVDYQVIAQEAEICSSTFEQETNLPSTQQDQSDRVTDKGTLSICDSDWKEDGGQAGEAIEEVVKEDQPNTLEQTVKFDNHLPQLDKQQVEIEQNKENSLTCNQEDGVLYDGADQVKEKMLTTDNIVEELGSSNVALPCLCVPVKVDNHDDGLSDITTDTRAKISGIADSPDLSLDCQQPQNKEEEKALSLDEVTNSTIPDPQMPSHDENQPENNGNGITVVLAEECNDHVHDHQQKDQQSAQMIDIEVSDKASITADPDTVQSVTASVIVKDISCPQLPSICQDQQSDHMENDETLVATRINSATDAPACDNATIMSPIMSEEISLSDVSSSSQDRQSVQMINIEVSDKASVAADVDIYGNVTASVIVEEISCAHPPSICQDQQSDRIEKNETSPMMSDILSSSQDQQIDQTKDNEEFSEVTTGAVPVTTEDIIPPICQIHLLPFEQSELRDNDISSPGIGDESGISSMAVSPDAGNEFDMVIENMVLPVMDCDLQSEGQAKTSLFADDVAVSVINGGTAGMVFGPYPSHPSKVPSSEHREWSKYESFAANEDMFGHEIEDAYHREMDQIMAQIAASVTSFTDELKIKTDIKAAVEVVEIKEKKAGVSVEKKEDTRAEEKEEDYEKTEISIMEATMDNKPAASVTSFTDELKIKTDIKAAVEVVEIKEKKAGVSVEKKEDTKAEEKEEDYEKTEISIMEATMDNNEWITESNYPVLPWLVPSTTSFAQDHTKTKQPPTVECQYSLAVTDTTCIDTTDIPSFTEDKETSTLSLVDENMENNKKVVAVQPMPQNVNVTFRIHYFTQSPYQTVAVTGNQQELGNWKEFIPLERAKDGHWSIVVSLPAESHVEWKFVVLNKGEVCRWEECGNRLLDTGYGDDLLIHKWWGHL